MVEVQRERMNGGVAVQLLAQEGTKLQLVDAGFRILDGYMRMIQSRVPDAPVCSFACVGKSRVGKSTLLNFMLPADEWPFATSNSSESCTSGLWVYAYTFIYPQNAQQTHTVLFFDVEGTDRGHDAITAQLLDVAVRLCSSILWNFSQDFTNSDIRTLSQITRALELRDSEFNTPNLNLVIRNAELDYAEGTVREYIDTRLTTLALDDGLNDARASIRIHFPGMIGLELPPPLLTRAKWRAIAAIQDGQQKKEALRAEAPEFMAAVEKLRDVDLSNFLLPLLKGGTEEKHTAMSYLERIYLALSDVIAFEPRAGDAQSEELFRIGEERASVARAVMEPVIGEAKAVAVYLESGKTGINAYWSNDQKMMFAGDRAVVHSHIDQYRKSIGEPTNGNSLDTFIAPHYDALMQLMHLIQLLKSANLSQHERTRARQKVEEDLETIAARNNGWRGAAAKLASDAAQVGGMALVGGAAGTATLMAAAGTTAMSATAMSSALAFMGNATLVAAVLPISPMAAGIGVTAAVATGTAVVAGKLFQKFAN